MVTKCYSTPVKYLEGLNERQKEAVLRTDGPLLIIAGAGAGKTKTITHRMAHLIASGVPGRNILAVTFTNKAAGEMRDRVRRLLPDAPGGMPLLATFHSLGVRLLREFHQEAGVERNFAIWDRDDSMKALKKIIESLGFGDLQAKSALGVISRKKGDGMSGADYAGQASNFREQTIARVWDAYEKTMRDEGALDFDDLLFRTLVLLRDSPQTLSLLQNRWTHITIDEYQDTNRAQYEIARLLAGERRNLCVVGDIDQCLVAGTKITMADGSARAIEKVRKGDMVCSNSGSGDMRSARVLRTYTRQTKKELVRITTKAGREIVSTPEHIHFAGYRLGLTPKLYFTYLMHKRNVGFRLGVSQTYTKGQRMPMIGFQQRNNHEHADEVWVLKTHDTPQEARILEYTLSLSYGIPTLPFVARKGSSAKGYVHDQAAIDRIFKQFNTESAGERLLAKHGLSLQYPHHRAQSNGTRNNIVITLCGEHRGKMPMHRISIAATDPTARQALEELGYSVRMAKKNSPAWRFETCVKDYGELRKRAMQIQAALPNARIVEVARLGGKKKNIRDGNSLPYLPAGSVLPGMAMFDESGGYDIVENVGRVPVKGAVYDLDIEGTHNFVANGLVTHNSIYTWRGADVEHLLAFDEAFPGASVVTLEQNYRSTRTILSAANAVIEKNVRRKPKTLFTENSTGDPLLLYGAQNEMDEAWFVAVKAEELIRQGMSPREIAVLYRENFQSRAIEEAFLASGIPYRILGTRFFERKEVKDTLSYLRAALNPKSGVDIRRIIAVPPRGIGKVTVDKMMAGESLPGAAGVKVQVFRDTLAAIKKAVETLPCAEAVCFAFEISGIEAFLKKDSEEGPERIGNVHELVNLAARYNDMTPPEGVERLLEEAALQSDQDNLDERQDAVSLMTVHASKGLEFDAVFITGLEQGLFPSIRENDPDRDSEEERRLFYVAVTRARKRLFLSYANERMKYGSREHALPSDFIGEIDQRLIEWASAKQSQDDDERTIELL